MEHAIEAAIREGIQEFDFLRGRESYKYLWGGRDRMNQRLLLWYSSRSEGARISAPTGIDAGRGASIDSLGQEIGR